VRNLVPLGFTERTKAQLEPIIETRIAIFMIMKCFTLFFVNIYFSILCYISLFVC
jgi:hypothetical protein